MDVIVETEILGLTRNILDIAIKMASKENTIEDFENLSNDLRKAKLALDINIETMKYQEERKL